MSAACSASVIFRDLKQCASFGLNTILQRISDSGFFFFFLQLSCQRSHQKPIRRTLNVLLEVLDCPCPKSQAPVRVERVEETGGLVVVAVGGVLIWLQDARMDKMCRSDECLLVREVHMNVNRPACGERERVRAAGKSTARHDQRRRKETGGMRRSASCRFFPLGWHLHFH